MNTINALLEKIERAKDLDFGNVLNSCITLFKKVWLQGLLVLILNAALIFPLVFIMYIPMIFMGIISPESFNENQGISELDSVGVFAIIISVALAIVVSILGSALTVGLKAAYFKIARNKDLNINQSDDYFFFLKKRYLKKTIILSLIIIGVSIIALLLFILPIFYVLIPLSYVHVIYALNPDLSEKEIIKAAFALGNKKWFFTFLMVIVAWFLSTVVGFLMCVVGIYVTQQFINLPFYQIYKETIGFNETSAIEEIGTSAE